MAYNYIVASVNDAKLPVAQQGVDMRVLSILLVLFALACPADEDPSDAGTADSVNDNVASDLGNDTPNAPDSPRPIVCNSISTGGDIDSCEIELSDCSDGVIYTAACTSTGAGDWACACYETGQPGEVGSFVSADICELTISASQIDAALVGCNWDLQQ